jgi:hypothetical protein
MGQVRDINTLHPELQAIVRRMQEQEPDMGVHETIRTVAYQDSLFARGRTAPGNIVTNARGQDFQSMHQWGIAFDFHHRRSGFSDTAFFRRIGALGKSLGLTWGGDFTSIVDMPHFELRKWGNTTAALRQRHGTPDRFRETWRGMVAQSNTVPPSVTPVELPPKDPAPGTLPMDEIARQVMRGNWGNGAERVRRLTDAGYDAAAVQRRVNELMRGG